MGQRDPERKDPPFLVVGHLNKVHGTKGELFVWPLTDHPESHFAPGVIFQIGNEAGERPDIVLPAITLSAVRPFRKGFLLQVEGVESRDQANLFVGRYLLRSIDEMDPLEPGEYFYHQLLGCAVVTVGGTELGEVMEVYELRPFHLLEVANDERVTHIPLSPSIVTEVDMEAKRITVDPPEGLLDQ